MEISGLSNAGFGIYEEETEDSFSSTWRGREINYLDKSSLGGVVRRTMQKLSMVLCMSRPSYEADVYVDKKPGEKPTATGSATYRGETKDGKTHVEGKAEAGTDGRVSVGVKVSGEF